MPRYAGAHWFSLFVVVALCAASAAACAGKREVRGADGGAATPTPDAAAPSEDASVTPPPMTVDAGRPQGPPWQPNWDAAAGFEGEYCYLHVGAQCDGPEDCPSSDSGAGACCARIGRDSLVYTSIECADSCDFSQTFPLCHAGLPCTADGNSVCRTSVLLPDDFIGVCAVPLPTLGPPTGEAVAGEIDCGPDRCVVGAEQCCMRKSFRSDRGSVAHEPYCAPLGEPCDCEDRMMPPRDAGGQGHEDDAG